MIYTVGLFSIIFLCGFVFYATTVINLLKHTDTVLMETFNTEQSKVIQHRGGARCILAGPGSGKTKTMVAFFKSLVDSGVPVSAIRCVTFSKEAAETIEKRAGVKGVFSTLHSLGYQICQDVGARPVEPELRHRLMSRLTRKWGIEYKDLDMFISRMRRSYISPQDAAESGEYGYNSCAAYAEYEKERREGGWIDFESMLCDSVQYLENPENRRRWQFQYLIVDEAQDTDDLQWRMMQLLSEEHGNITVVGDPNQCQPAGTKVRTPKGLVNIENLRNGEDVLSWTQCDQRIYTRSPRKIHTASRRYSGDLLTLRSNGKETRVTPNHFLYVKLDKKAVSQKPFFVYLMWRRGLGFRVGTSTVRSNRSGGSFLTMRARQEKADKMWILMFCRSKQETETWEEMISLRYRIPECMFHTYNGIKKTDEQIQMIFRCADPNGGFNCLRDYHLMFNYPLVDREKKQNFRGYFQIAAANLIPKLMMLPTEEINGSASLDGIDRHPFDGEVYSLDVEKDHTYVADGIPVGNCIYSFRGAVPENITKFEKWFPKGRYYYLGKNYRSNQAIVDFVRRHAPRGCPKELKDKMVSARKEVGVPIGIKQYWSEDDEAESAIKLSQADPLNTAILARTNRLIGSLERICQRHSVRYHLLGKTGFWKQTEIRKAIDQLKEFGPRPTSMALGFVLPQMKARYAVDDRTERDNDALENLQTLETIAKDFPRTQEFCVHANKMMHRRNDPKGVSLSTVHQAKGGEWKNVLIIGAKQGCMPHKNGDILEEERIFFVAISRAIDRLRISWTGTPSQFLDQDLTEEIKDKLLEKAGEVDKFECQEMLFNLGHRELKKTEANHSLLDSAKTWAQCRLEEK